MRGVSILLAHGAVVLALSLSANARASALDGVKALAAEKAAAVTLLKHRTETQIAIAANDRLFAAYLNAATMSEGARLTPRIQAVLTNLLGHYGIREAAVADRAGAFLVRVGNVDRTVAALDPKTDPLFQAALATSARRSVSLGQTARIDLAAPFVMRGEPEFVVTARQDFSSYRNVLARGTNADRFAVLTDAKGVILADSRHGGAGTTAIVAGLTLGAALKALDNAPAGEVVANELRYKVSVRAAGEWNIVAVERIPAPRRCHSEGARLCG